MKKIRSTLFVVLTLTLAFSLAACSMGSEYDIGGGEDYGSMPSGFTKEKISDGEVTEDKGSSSETEKTDETQYQSGLITAAAWNDNQYYEPWKKLFIKGQNEEKDGKFSSRVENRNWGFVTTNRVKVVVKNGESVVSGATVSFYDSQQNPFIAKTDAQGTAYIFPSAESGEVTVTVGDKTEKAAFTAEERDLTVDIATANDKADLIKLMFVIDVTGSMGDELNYMKAELRNVINRVASDNNGVRIDLALLFYRDNGDQEKFSYADFVDVTTEEGLVKQQDELKKQFADGGGDYEEAVDEALMLAMSKNWGDENSTKIIFHILDAPPHGETINVNRFNGAVKTAAEKGIRLCPILCSGADSLCEYLTRQEAIYTGGTFIFVTDHSGIGGEHLDPDLPNAVIEKLNDMLVRLINGYHTGNFADPVWWNASTKTEPDPEQQSGTEPADTVERL